MKAKKYFRDCANDLNLGNCVRGMYSHQIMRAHWVSELVNEDAVISELQLVDCVLALFFCSSSKREEDGEVAIRIATFINTCH